MIALTGYPCYCEDCDQPSSEEVYTEQSETHGNETTDLCTPFCTDTCCTIHVIRPDIDLVVSIKPSNADRNAIWLSDIPTLVTVAIWQPPKIS